jgi:hypothetical protein
MAAKTFVNETKYDLSVMLTVRKGDRPGTDTAPVAFTLEHGKRRSIGYGDAHSPYLDGIAANAVDRGNIIASQDFVITRGSGVDNSLNTHDTVVFSMEGVSLALSFRNG